ncbi:MAG TPA: hypothetical protein DEF07_06580 [Nitrosomonas sp.]|nr:hypothetical protein [Nitrosomonas sp.]
MSGKSFNLSDKPQEFDNTKHYGKAAFARDVVAKNASTLDFSGFDEILDRLVAVIADYASKHPTASVPGMRFNEREKLE